MLGDLEIISLDKMVTLFLTAGHHYDVYSLEKGGSHSIDFDRKMNVK